DLHTISYEQVGNPNGRPAVFLHGGPGVGISPGYRRFFDPDHYRVILPDQRGAGQSAPYAEFKDNTTWDLVDDLEELRRHLGIKDWVVMGGSWGSLLALCYAIEHPTSVAGLIIRGVFLGRQSEIEWLHEAGGASEIYPDEWAEYRKLPDKMGSASAVPAYLECLSSDDEATRIAAARAWRRWEGSMAAMATDEKTIVGMQDDWATLPIARIECSYTHNNFFLKSDNHVLENCHRIADIPCRIVQGRYDIICPAVSAWQVHKALPQSKLSIVQDGAHSPMDRGMAVELVNASEAFKSL
ncbi:MAG: prolyl aminopeptidase, partial [Pseudomonadota bacterium]